MKLKSLNFLAKNRKLAKIDRTSQSKENKTTEWKQNNNQGNKI
jgi:hypothetical protein